MQKKGLIERKKRQEKRRMGYKIGINGGNI